MRPSKYKPEFCEQARKLCRLGATDQDTADFFEVTVQTLFNWKEAHPEFLEALKEAKLEADTRVVESLYHRATGYSHEAVKIFMPAGASEPVVAKYREHYPPDTTAAIFWLKNRQPEKWRDIQKHEHGRAGDFDNMTADELRADIIREAKELGLETGSLKALGRAGKANGSGRPH